MQKALPLFKEEFTDIFFSFIQNESVFGNYRFRGQLTDSKQPHRPTIGSRIFSDKYKGNLRYAKE